MYQTKTDFFNFFLRFLFRAQRKKETRTQKVLEKDEGAQREKERTFPQKGVSSPFAIDPYLSVQRLLRFAGFVVDPAVAEFFAAGEFPFETVVVAFFDHLAEEAESVLEVLESGQVGRGVVFDDLPPHGRIAGGDPGGVAESGCATGETACLFFGIVAFEDRQGEGGGHDVEDMAGVGHQIVVGRGIDPNGLPDPHRLPELLQCPQMGFLRERAGREESVGIAVELGKGIIEAGLLRAGHGMAPREDDAPRGQDLFGFPADDALHAAHVGNEGAGPEMRCAEFQIPEDLRDGQGQDRDVRFGDGFLRGFADLIQGVRGKSRCPDFRTPGPSDPVKSFSLESHSEGAAQQPQADNGDFLFRICTKFRHLRHSSLFFECRMIFARQTPRGNGELYIVSSAGTRQVQHLPGEEKSLHQTAPHGFRIHLLQIDPA